MFCTKSYRFAHATQFQKLKLAAMKRRTKGRTWADAAKMVLEKHPKTPMSHKEILRIIQEENLKDLSGTTPLLCLNSCLHANSRGLDSMFYKVAGKSGVYGLMTDLPEGSVLCEMDDDSDSMTELIDDNGRPVQPGGQGSSRSFSDKRKDKVMYVKLPKGFPILSAAEDAPPLGLVNGHSETSSTVTDISETLSEAPSTDTPASSTPSLVDIIKEEGQTTDQSDHTGGSTGNPHGGCSTSSTLLTAANRLAVAKRKSRNNPLRHYTKRRKKKKNKFSRIKVRTSTSSLKSLTHKSVSSPVSGMDSSGSPSPTVNPITGIAQPKRQTLREMLAGLPGFNFKPRNRKNRLSMAAQIQQTKEGCVDLENPTSILVNTNLKNLLNKHTFAMLPAAYQYQLIKLLPECDQIMGPENSLRMNATALSNEFFSKASTEWRDRLADGEFTQESQIRIKQEEEKQQQKLDPWKVKHFEPVWGKRSVQSPVSLPKSPSFAPTLFTSTASVRTEQQTKLSSPSQRSKLGSTVLKEGSLPQSSANVINSKSAHAHNTRSNRLVGIVDKLFQQKSARDTGESTLKTESPWSCFKDKAIVDEEIFVEDVVKEVVTTPMGHSSNELLLQQLKRPPDIKPETIIPPKKPRPSPPVEQHMAFRTESHSSSGQSVAAHQTVQKVKSPPLSGIQVQGISVAAAHPSLSSSLGTVAQVVTVQNQVVSVSKSHDGVHVQTANPGRAYQVTSGMETSFVETTPVTVVNVGGTVISSNAAKTLAQMKVLQAAKPQGQAQQQSQPRTRTLADIKAHLKAKTQPRHLPSILQGKHVASAPPGRPNVECTTLKESPDEFAGKIDMVRSKAIVEQAIEQSRQNQSSAHLLSNTNSVVVQKATRTVVEPVKMVTPVTLTNQIVVKQQETEGQGTSGLLMVKGPAQVQQQPRRTQIVSQSAVSQPATQAVKMVQVHKQQQPAAVSKVSGSMTVAEQLRLLREQSQPAGAVVTSNSTTISSLKQHQAIISNVSHQVSVQTQPASATAAVTAQRQVTPPIQPPVVQTPVTPVTTQGTNMTAVILPPQQSLASSSNTKVYVVDQKNSVAAGGQNPSTLSSAHQPERKPDLVTTATTTSTQATTVRSVTPVSSIKVVPVCKQIVYVSQGISVSAPKTPSPVPVQTTSIQPTPSTAVGTLPKIKFIRVTSADGEIRYVLSSNSNNNSSNAQQNKESVSRNNTAAKGSASNSGDKVTTSSSNTSGDKTQDTKITKVNSNASVSQASDHLQQSNVPAPSSTSLGKNSHLSSSHPSLQRLLSGEADCSVSSAAAAIVNQVLAANPPPPAKGSAGRPSVNTTIVSQATSSGNIHKTSVNVNSSSALLQALRGSNGIHSKKQGGNLGDAVLDSSLQSPPKPQRVLSPTQVGGIKMAIQEHSEIGMKSTQKSNCVCNMRAMVMCKKCGTYCHDDCIGPSKLCVRCIIAT